MKQVRLGTRGVWGPRSQVKKRKSISRRREWLVNWVTDMKNEGRPSGMARSMPLAASVRAAPRVGWGQKPDWVGFKQKEREDTELAGRQLCCLCWQEGFCYKEEEKSGVRSRGHYGIKAVLLLFIIIITYLYTDEIIL